MGLLNIFLKKKPPDDRKTLANVDRHTLTVKRSPALQIHNDLRGLLWFADGPLKNYSNEAAKYDSIDLGGGIKISFSIMGADEPSLIYVKEPVTITSNDMQIDRPPYFPTYKGLSSEQRGEYFKLLQNPYDSSIDIGYVFILYYGLERHLLSGDFEKAFKTILKLRDVHTNKSFQTYSANSLVLTSMLHRKGEFALEFIKSLDKEHELQFSDNLFLMCYYSFHIPLTAKDLIRLSKSFSFTNNNYIKKYPELFEKELKQAILDKTKKEVLFIEDHISAQKILKLRKQESTIFANVSILDKTIQVPMFTENPKLIVEMNAYLKTAHEQVKKDLAAARKQGEAITPKNNMKADKTVLVFDHNLEQELLEGLKKVENNPVQKHFIYLQLEDFYYKFRGVDEKYTEECMQYCLRDIKNLKIMEQAYVNERIDEVKKLAKMTSKNNHEIADEIEVIKKQGFEGRVPSFKRLVIIYEKRKEFDNAIKVCDLAIAFGHEIDIYSEIKMKVTEKKDKA